MRIVQGLNLNGSTSEEQLPDFSRDFPCITTRAELHHYPNALMPWHWHPTVELFWMLDGAVDYHIPDHTIHIGSGQGGLLLPDILHKSSWEPETDSVMLLQIFDPAFLFGDSTGRMGRKYVEELLNDSERSFLLIDSTLDEMQSITELLQSSFHLDESEKEYEYALRDTLCRIWLKVLDVPSGRWLSSESEHNSAGLRQIITYIQSHLDEDIDIHTLADCAHISVRSCYRLFRDIMDTTPGEYIRENRIRLSCQMLADTDLTVTEIAFRTGFGSLSYYGRIFRHYMGCTPNEFREWHNRINH